VVPFPNVFRFITADYRTRESMVRARELFESARKNDPDWARPLVGLSWVYWNETRYEWTDDPEEWMRKGFELAEKAVELEPEEPGEYQKLAMLNLSWGDYDSAIAFREKALKLAPNDFVVVWGLGYVLYNAGDAQRGVDFLKKAERMSPHPPVFCCGRLRRLNCWPDNTKMPSRHPNEPLH
jgi:adenylate cyclase